MIDEVFQSVVKGQQIAVLFIAHFGDFGVGQVEFVEILQVERVGGAAALWVMGGCELYVEGIEDAANGLFTGRDFKIPGDFGGSFFATGTGMLL